MSTGDTTLTPTTARAAAVPTGAAVTDLWLVFASRVPQPSELKRRRNPL